MRVNNMTLEQCKRIINEGFVGSHDSRGKQVDYSDYKTDILRHYWALSDRKLSKPISQYGYRAEIEPEAFEVGIQDYVNKAFKPWRYLADNIEMRLI